MTSHQDAAGRLLLLLRWPQAGAAAVALLTAATAPQSSPLLPAPAKGHAAKDIRHSNTSMLNLGTSHNTLKRKSATTQLAKQAWLVCPRMPRNSTAPTHQVHCLGLSF